MSLSALKDNFNLTTAYAVVVSIALACAGCYIYQSNPIELQHKLDVANNENMTLESHLNKCQAELQIALKKIEQYETVMHPDPLNPDKQDIKKLQDENLRLKGELEVTKKEASNKSAELTDAIKNLNNTVDNLNNEIKIKNKEIQHLKDNPYPEQAKLLEDIAIRRELLNRCKDAYYLYIIRLTQKVAIEKFPEDYNNGEADKYKKKNGLPFNDTLDGPDNFPKLSSYKLGIDTDSLINEKANLEKDLDNCIKAYKKYVDWMYWYTNEKEKKGPVALGCTKPEDFERDFRNLKSN